MRPILVLLPAACLLLIAVLIYRDFLFGDLVLLYEGIGSDSLHDYYPSFVHLSDYLRNEGLPSWSFYTGMGQDLYSLVGYLILQPVTWLPRGLIAQALVYQHLGKVLLAGLLFFSFLRLRSLQYPACLLGASLLSFSAYMTMGSCWFPLADEVVCFAALLLAVELALSRGQWFFLTLGVTLTGFLGAFYLYLCAFFLLCYVPARLWGRHGWQPRFILQICLLLAGAAALGVGLGAFITLPNLYALLNSPRGSGTTSLVARLSSSPVFGLQSSLHYVTAALRPLANDALGTADSYRGWGNYLEAPLTYCGLLCVILLPQVFVESSRRQRIIGGLFLSGLLVPTIFPWFRYLFWAFQGDYYRTYSLFCVLGVITLSAISFSRYLEGRPLNLWLLLATILLVAGILYLPIQTLKTVISPGVRQGVTILLFCYGALLGVGQLTKRTKLAAWVILALTAVELIQFNRMTVSNRRTVSKHELIGGVAGDSETTGAVQDIKRRDNTFFRLTTLRQSERGTETNLNDSIMLRYYGTSSYTSFNNVNYTNFLTALEAMPPNSEAATRWAIGLAGNFIPSIFAGEKYALVEDPAPFQQAAQYESVRGYGKYSLFQNTLFLPMGLIFDRYLPEDSFRKLARDDKEQSLLAVAVLANKEEARARGLERITISELQRELATTSFPATIEKRRKTALSLTSFRQTKIEGTVRLDRKSILVLQTPFDRGWRAFQDGLAAATLKVDAGLLGVVLDPGEHNVAVRYSTPFLAQGLMLSLVSVALAALGYWRWPRLRLPA